MSDAPEAVVRRAPDARAVGEWALVLAAAGIAHRVRETPHTWLLLVAADDRRAAEVALDEYDCEARPQPEPLAASHAAPTSVGLIAGGLLIVADLVTRTRPGWIAAGRMVAGRFRDGEWWRAVTALTLHVDAAHLAGNLVGCVVLLPAVCRAVGVGVGVWLVLIAGAGGNALAALGRPPGATSLGASTAVFGAVGVLAGLEFVRRRRDAAPGRRPWIAIGAALALLAFLGTGERADLSAHLAGLLVGLAAGAAAAVTLRRPPGAVAQRALAMAAGAAVVLAWLRALGATGSRSP